jgi:hypothetical protein
MMVLGLGPVVASSFWSAPAAATTLAPLTQVQLVDAADLIVRGKVLSVWTMTNPAHHIVTRALVQVSRSYKGGTAEGTVLTVDSPGGEYAGILSDVDAAARYSVDEDVLLFLNPVYSGEVYSTVGMFLGKYTIRQNPADGSEMPVRFSVPYTRSYDARFIPHPPVAERIRLTDFEAQIQSRLDQGWDGQPIPGASSEHLRVINRLQPGVK